MSFDQVKIVQLSPTKTATLVWQPEHGPPVLTVVCKMTYELKSGVALLAEAQDDVNERDLHSENNPALGLHSASDLVPFKRKADVSVVGKVFAPPGELAHSLIARLKVGSVDKQIEVHAERYLSAAGELKADAFFSKMPLGYERAAGGKNTVNPAGRSLSDPPDSSGRRLLPNMVVPGEPIQGSGVAPTPVGLGPIPATWPSRRQLLGERSANWQGADWSAQPIPSDWNWAFFNVVPPDQQLDEIRPDEHIRLEHLHPDEPTLDTRLPGLSPCVYVERSQGAEKIVLKGDTLWIDTNRLVQTVTWRGQLSLDHLSESLRVVVALAQPGQDLAWEQLWTAAEHDHSTGPVGAEDEKTLIRARRDVDASPLSQSNVTSPVPLVPSSDLSPEWLPVASSRGGVLIQHQPDAAQVLEVPLDPADEQRLNELCLATGRTPIEVLTDLLRQGHDQRFGRS